MNRNKLIFIFSFLLIFWLPVSSQVPFTVSEIGSEFYRGMEMFNKEKYPAAIRLFDSFIRNGDKSNLILVADAEYYSSIAAIKLFNPDAEYRMMMFIYSHPESPRINNARLELGNYFYQNKNYRKAVVYYESVNRQELKSDKLAEYFFRLGYSLYIKGDQSRALLMFSEIKDIDTEYTPPAIYYFSQIAYEQKQTHFYIQFSFNIPSSGLFPGTFYCRGNWIRIFQGNGIIQQRKIRGCNKAF